MLIINGVGQNLCIVLKTLLYDDVLTIFCDEISMVGSDKLTKITTECKIWENILKEKCVNTVFF